MTDEQKQANAEANKLDATTAFVTLSDAQMKALRELELYDGRKNVAQAAFDSAVRSKLQASIDRAIREKYMAEGKGKKELAAEYEKEIQRGMALKREL